MKKPFSVLADDLEHCIITGDSNIAIHHVFNGPNRHLSEKYGFLVPLRPDWHNMTAYSIHMDQQFDESMKRKAQRYYEEHYGNREDFIREFGKSYLDDGCVNDTCPYHRAGEECPAAVGCAGYERG